MKEAIIKKLMRTEGMEFFTDEQVEQMMWTSRRGYDCCTCYPLAKDYPIGTELKRYSDVDESYGDVVSAITCLAENPADAIDFMQRVYGYSDYAVHEEPMDEMRPQDVDWPCLVRYVVLADGEDLTCDAAWDRCYESYKDAMGRAKELTEDGDDAGISVVLMDSDRQWDETDYIMVAAEDDEDGDDDEDDEE